MSEKEIKILLVEDNPGDARLISEMARRFEEIHPGLETKTSLHELMEMDEAHEMDIILLDLSLPDASGLELLSKVQQRFPHTPVVIITGLNDMEMVKKTVGLGAQDYLIKSTLDKVLLERSIQYSLWRNKYNTQRVEMETTAREKQKLQELNTRLEQKHKELENFTYILSHDVLAPLRNVATLSQLFSDEYSDKVDEQGKEYLRLMNEKISLLSSMIDEVLSYIKAGKSTSEKAIIETNAVLNDIIKLQTAPGKNRTFLIDNPLPNIFASSTTMKQVFSNLIDNAIKHNDKNEVVIHIGCAEVDGYWQFYVKDNGPGIPKEFHNKLFQIFQTLSPKPGTKSNGIGLATVKRGIESEGGRIWLESENGKGCTFFFTIKKTDTLKKKKESAGDVGLPNETLSHERE